jgi:hypothetical protein
MKTEEQTKKIRLNLCNRHLTDGFRYVRYRDLYRNFAFKFVCSFHGGDGGSAYGIGAAGSPVLPSRLPFGVHNKLLNEASDPTIIHLARS